MNDKKDVYKLIDQANKSLKEIERIGEEVKKNDPEFYKELQAVINGNRYE